MSVPAFLRTSSGWKQRNLEKVFAPSCGPQNDQHVMVAEFCIPPAPALAGGQGPEGGGVVGTNFWRLVAFLHCPVILTTRPWE